MRLMYAAADGSFGDATGMILFDADALKPGMLDDIADVPDAFRVEAASGWAWFCTGAIWEVKSDRVVQATPGRYSVTS